MSTLRSSLMSGARAGWSAINSLMVAARSDRPAALKAIIVCCGSDDRYSDDSVFRYTASVRTFIGAEGAEELFEERSVDGEIPRAWV